jgi:cyanate permease
MGLQFALLGLANAGGPFAAGVLRDALGSYSLLPPAVIVMLLLAIPAILIAEREGRTGAT